MKTLLAIGDKKDFDAFAKFLRQKKLFKKYNISFKHIDYGSVLEGKLPEIETKNVIIFPFFPYKIWEKCIKIKKSKGVYGNRNYFIKFKKFWRKIYKILKRFYKDKKVHFINHPNKIFVERDKEVTKKVLAKAGIPVPRSHFTRDYKKIFKMVNDGQELFIKVRYGSMGKGITYLEKGRWMTNFRFKNNKIICRKSDYDWTFVDITGNRAFLKKLLLQDIVIEDAVNPLLLDKRKFDLRVYVAFGKVLYVYPRSNEREKITTNISQGARGEGPQFTRRIPPKILNKAIKNALKAVKAVGLDIAGIDIIPNSSKHCVTVVELNSFPGYPKARRFNLAKHLIEAIGKQKWD